MTESRKIIAAHPRVKDQIQVGDILIFKQSTGAAAYVQSIGKLAADDKSNKESSHAAVVVGKTFDGISIISHMIGDGNKTERLDCSGYRFREFEIHSAKNSIVRMEIADNMDLQPEITKILSSTVSRVVNENPENVRKSLSRENLIGPSGNIIYTNKSGVIGYSKMKVVKAAAAALLGSPTSSKKATENVDNKMNKSQIDTGKKFNISDHIVIDVTPNETRRENSGSKMKVDDDQMCISLVVLAIQNADKILKGDYAVQYADEQLINHQVVKHALSDKIKKWLIASRNSQVLKLQIQNIRSAMLPAELNRLLTNADTIMNSVSTEELINDKKPCRTIFDKQVWERESDKIGGANVGNDQYTGVYVRYDNDDDFLERALIKQDWDGNKVRVAKIIGEGLAGTMLNDIYTNVMGIDKDRFASVKLGRFDSGGLDEDGTSTYLLSVYINGYQDDLWKAAYRDKFKANYLMNRADSHSLHITQDQKDNLITYLQVNINKLFKQYTAMSGLPDMDEYDLEEVEEALHRQIDMQNLIKGDTDVKINTDEIDNMLNELIDDLVEIDLSNMARPSGMFLAPNHIETRSVISNFISKPPFLAEFANLAAPRLLLGDFGLHNANFGVANDFNGDPHLVALDYGAAFLNMIENLNPYDNTKTGISGLDKYYKNHFLEYGKEIVTSLEMANAFIKLNKMSESDIRKYVINGFSEIHKHYGKTAIVEFCQRMGMDSQQIQATGNINKKVVDFICGRLIERKKSLVDIGYGILFERCYDPDINKLVINLKNAFKDNPELTEFFIKRFDDVELLVHNEMDDEIDVLMREAAKIIHRQQSFFNEVINNNDKAVIAYILKEGSDGQIINKALSLTMKNDNSDMANLLINLGANIYAQGKSGKTLFEYAQSHGKNSNVLSLFKIMEEKINRFASYVSKNDVGRIQAMIDQGYNVNFGDKAGDTALHIAVRKNNPDLVALLLQHGAEIHKINSNNESPLAIAVNRKFSAIRDIFEKTGVPLYIAEQSAENDKETLPASKQKEPSSSLNALSMFSYAKEKTVNNDEQSIKTARMPVNPDKSKPKND